MFLSMMMTLTANNLHVGIFGGWNGFKFALDKKDLSEEGKKLMDEMNKMQNSGIFGGECGWRIFVMDKFFMDPTLSIGYTQKSKGEDPRKLTSKQLPIHFLLKTGYAMNDALSLYGIVGGGVNVLWDNNPQNNEKRTRGDFTVGAGAAFYFQKYISIFAEYRYARTFLKKDKDDGVKGINSNRVVGGLQFNF